MNENVVSIHSFVIRNMKIGKYHINMHCNVCGSTFKNNL